MLRNRDQMPAFANLARVTDLARSGGPQKASSPWRVATLLPTLWDALRESLSAWRQYEHLTSRGIPHDPALRQAIGLAHPPSDAPPAVPRRRSCLRTAGRPGAETITRRRQDFPDAPDQTVRTPASARIGNLAYVA